MRYQQSIKIHQRLETALKLIKSSEYSAPALAEQIGVSIPTVSRIVAALREQGHDIRAERTKLGWRYFLANHHTRPSQRGGDLRIAQPS